MYILFCWFFCSSSKLPEWINEALVGDKLRNKLVFNKIQISRKLFNVHMQEMWKEATTPPQLLLGR